MEETEEVELKVAVVQNLKVEAALALLMTAWQLVHQV